MNELTGWLAISAFCLGFVAGVTLTIAGFIGSMYLQKDEPGITPKGETK